MFRVADAKNVSPLEVMAMPFAEYQLWVEFYRRFGTATDRTVWVTALAGAAVCRTWGGKIKPHDLIPDFRHPPASERRKVLAAKLTALAGAKVGRVNREEMARRLAASKGN